MRHEHAHDHDDHRPTMYSPPSSTSFEIVNFTIKCGSSGSGMRHEHVHDHDDHRPFSTLSDHSGNASANHRLFSTLSERSGNASANPQAWHPAP